MQEEIIIDGVNVAGCPHKKKEVTFMNVIKCYNYGACEGVNYLYKQLKRLEQENKELKEKNKNIKAHKDFLFKENDKLMHDNSIMRIALNEIKDVTTNALAKQRPYKEDFIDIQEIINKIAERQEKNNYRSALEDIRGYFLNPNSNLELQTRQVMLNKINEVLQ